MHLRIAACIAFTVLMLASTTGCKSLEERFTPPPKVVTEEATVAVAGAAVTGELAETTPEGLPLWPGAEVTESVGTEDAYGLSMITGDPFEDVLNGVAAGFESAGWEVARDAASQESTGAALLTVSSETGEGFVSVTDLGDGTSQIDYTITAPQ